MKRLGKCLSYIFLGLVAGLAIFALVLPVVFSGTLAIVRSSSMEPAIPAGALAMMEPIIPEEVKVGDIIVFTPPLDPDVTVSHRVIELRANGELYFVTKGDAVEEPDPFLLPASNVQGKVVFNVPRLGYVASSVTGYVRTRLGLVFLVCVPLVVLISSAIRDVNRSRNVRLRRLKNRLNAQRRWGRQRVHGLV